jgi:hypothetical protein
MEATFLESEHRIETVYREWSIDVHNIQMPIIGNLDSRLQVFFVVVKSEKNFFTV